MVKYPIGIQTFEKIRKEGSLYLDKTAFVHRLVCNSGFYFLSRPRRFGKSLLLSMMEAYFSDKKELFDIRKLYKIGVKFSSVIRGIDGIKIE